MKDNTNNDTIKQPPTTSRSTTIRLPGYEAQLNEDGICHSKHKVENSADELYNATNGLVDRNNISTIASSFRVSSVDNHNDSAVDVGGSDETLNYRCSCAFQIITTNTDDDDTNTDESKIKLHYAMRQNKEAVLINANYFPIATPRIQNVMKRIMEAFNQEISDNESNSDSNSNDATSNTNDNINHSSNVLTSNSSTFEKLKKHLSSASFVSSWNDDLDCIVTFNYDQPIGIVNDESSPSSDESPTLLMIRKEAEELCSKCNISTLILRSKKKKMIAGGHRKQHPFIRDVIHISIPKEIKEEDDNNNDNTMIHASLGKQQHNCNSLSSQNDIITIHYEKPQDAFQHPNHNAMLQALGWMLTKLNSISKNYRQKQQQQRSMNDNLNANDEMTLNLLEMYCGCGAHTIPIAKTGFFDSIVTIEIDNRLVESCKKNAMINGCNSSSSNGDGDGGDGSGGTANTQTTPIYIFQGDAGEWSRKFMKHHNKNTNQANHTTCTTTSTITSTSMKTSTSSLFHKNYHVLLVDPPRAGLDDKVCELAKAGSFNDLIYISCGREALKGDIVKLSDTFEVVDCTIIDLFPRTNAVESLVHLQRRK